MTERDGADRIPTHATRRRRFLRSIGTVGALGTAGCVSDPEAGSDATDEDETGNDHASDANHNDSGNADTDNAVRIAYDPYDGVDWDAVDHHKCEFHNHVRGPMEEPAEIVDLYHELGYTVFAVADKGSSPMKWPWTGFSDVDSSFENRDPEELGVVAFPGCEFTVTEHVSSIFSTLDHAAADADEIEERWDQSEQIVERTDHYVPEDGGGMAVLAHPATYYDDPDEDWERYRTDFESLTREQGMVGIEAFNRAAILRDDVHLWDNLLSHFAPDRMIWGFGVDDPTEYEYGFDVDVNWTSILLDDAEFDPSDQPGSRRAAANAVTAGRTLLHRRRLWDPDSSDPASVPRVRSIDVDPDAGEITIDATDYDALEWVGDGDVVSTDETLVLAPEHVPYVRAHLSNEDGGETSTQPFGLEAI